MNMRTLGKRLYSKILKNADWSNINLVHQMNGAWKMLKTHPLLDDANAQVIQRVKMAAR